MKEASEKGPEGCARVAGRLPLLVDGALGALDLARDLGHLEACPSCRAEHERFVGLLARLPEAWTGGLAAEAARLGAAVWRELGNEPPPRRVRRFTPSPALAAAMAAGLLLVLRLWFGQDLAFLPVQEVSVELDPLLQRLPDWSEVWGGLGRLSRWVS